jgi:outer membrane protein assembly factor BamB
VDATTGDARWSATIPGQFASAYAPVASEGIVYTLEDAQVTAFDESTGAQLWSASDNSGTDGSLAVTLDGVYTAGPCTPDDLDPTTGATIWNSNTGCEGGGGATPVVASGYVFSPISVGTYGGNVYAADTGTLLRAFNYSVPPAVSATTIYALTDGTLQGITLGNNQVDWSFAGDGLLTTSPIVVNNYVFVGSSSGNLYALNATTGALVWTKNLGAAIAPASQITSGLTAGDGLLIVPAGNTITAYVLSTTP